MSTKLSRRHWHNDPLEITEGGLYEVWLHHDWEEPRTCVTMIRIATDVMSPNWEVLVDGQVMQVHTGQIFRPGTAIRPEPIYYPHYQRPTDDNA